MRLKKRNCSFRNDDKSLNCSRHCVKSTRDERNKKCLFLKLFKRIRLLGYVEAFLFFEENRGGNNDEIYPEFILRNVVDEIERAKETSKALI